jgi:hypothetical protein
MQNVKFSNYYVKMQEIKGAVSDKFATDLTYIGWTNDDINKLRQSSWWSIDEDYFISNDEKDYYDEYKEGGLYANEVINSGYSELLNMRIFPKMEYESFDISELFKNKQYIEALPSSSKLFTNMEESFMGCTNLKYSPEFVTSSCTNFKSCFKNCYSIKEIVLNISSAQYITDCFNGCHNVRNIDINGNNSPITDIENLCKDCFNLVSLKTLDMKNVTNAENAFANCRSLVTLYLKNLKTNIDLSDCPYLSKESLIYILENAKNSVYTIKLSYITYETYFGGSPDAECINLKNSLTSVTVTR